MRFLIENSFTSIEGTSSEIKYIDDVLSVREKGFRFAKAFRAGFWDGYIHLLKNKKFRTGLLPYCVRMCAKRELDVELVDNRKNTPKIRKKVSLHLPPNITEIRDFQKQSITELLKRKESDVPFQRGIIEVGTGGGKTLIIALICSKLPQKTLIIVNSIDLLHQTSEDLKNFLGEEVGIIGAGHDDQHCRVTVSTVQTLSRNVEAFLSLLNSVETLVIDECFPAGTKVGDKNIEDIKVGDVVPSFDEKTNSITYNQVTHVFKNKVKRLIKIHLKNKDYLVCTPNHPVLTKRGWVPASLLHSDDMMCYTIDYEKNSTKFFMRRMQNSRDTNRSERYIRQKNKKSILFNRMLAEVYNPISIRNNGKDKPKICLNKNEDKKPNVQCRYERKGGNLKTSKRKLGTNNPGWQRARADNPRKNVISSVRVENQHNCPEEGRTALSLQNRCRKPGTKSSNRSRWTVSLWEKTRDRQKKGDIFKWVGVDCVEVLKPGRDRKFGEVCADGYVYNLEVKDTHTYLANNYVVHNCHHTSAKSFIDVADMCINASVRVGLSGTPFKDNNPLHIQQLRSVLGDPLIVVSSSRLIQDGIVAPVTVLYVPIDKPKTITRVVNSTKEKYKVSTLPYREVNFEGNLECPGAYEELIVRNEYRNSLFCSWVQSRDKPTLVIVDRIEHGEIIQSILGCPFLRGSESPEARKQALEDVRTGKLKTLIATPIFDEGVNAPAIKYLALLSGGKAPGRLKQRIGRGMRKTGEELVVLDSLDLTHSILAKHSKERIKTCVKAGFKIKRVDPNELQRTA